MGGSQFAVGSSGRKFMRLVMGSLSKSTICVLIVEEGGLEDDTCGVVFNAHSNRSSRSLHANNRGIVPMRVAPHDCARVGRKSAPATLRPLERLLF